MVSGQYMKDANTHNYPIKIIIKHFIGTFSYVLTLLCATTCQITWTHPTIWWILILLPHIWAMKPVQFLSSESCFTNVFIKVHKTFRKFVHFIMKKMNWNYFYLKWSGCCESEEWLFHPSNFSKITGNLQLFRHPVAAIGITSIYCL